MNASDTLYARAPVDVFGPRDIDVLLCDLQGAARHNKLSRDVRAGKLLRLKRGVYAQPDSRAQHLGLHPFVIAHKLYFPSTISFESALSHYGLIPEAVPETTCATTLASVQIETPHGNYSYRWLPPHIYSAGILREAQNGHVYLIAHPLRALLDLLYTGKREIHSLADLEQDLRIDLNALASTLAPDKNRDIESFKSIYRRANVQRAVDLILWELL